jgi:adenylate kinase
MLNLVLFGPPGAGKGTQSQKIVDKYGLIHLSTGDIFRDNIKGNTELGTLAKSYMDKGELVPDEVTIKMLQAEVAKNENAAGFIFDGFPRTIPQAEALDALMTKLNTSITLMIELSVPEEELIKRLLLRGKDSGRPDDVNPEVIANRIAVYHKHTAIAADHYSRQGKYHKVEGVGAIEDIFNSITGVMDGYVLV